MTTSSSASGSCATLAMAANDDKLNSVGEEVPNVRPTQDDVT